MNLHLAVVLQSAYQHVCHCKVRVNELRSWVKPLLNVVYRAMSQFMHQQTAGGLWKQNVSY